MTGQHRVLYTGDEIRQTVARLAAEVRQDYWDKQPLLVSTLKGSFVFLADFMRELRLPVEIDFIRLESYGAGTESSGRIKVVHPLTAGVTGKDVIVIEDIVDTGLTASFLLDYLKRKKPASLRLCTLLDKPSRRMVPVQIDYCGLTLPDAFVIGYGLDCNQKYRHLPDICCLE